MAFTPKLGKTVEAATTTESGFKPKLGKAVQAEAPAKEAFNPGNVFALSGKKESTAPFLNPDRPKGAKGFMSFLAGAAERAKPKLQERWEAVKSDFAQYDDPNAKRGFLGEAAASAQAALRTAGNVAGAVSDVVGAGIEQNISQDLSQESKTALKENVGELAKTAKVPEIMASYETWKEQNPDAAKNLEATVNIASLFPMEKVIGLAGKGVKTGLGIAEKGAKEVVEAIPTAGRIAGQAAETLEKRSAEQATEEALKLTKPILNIKEKEAAIAEGRIKKTLLGGTEVTPSKRDIDVAKSVQDVAIHSDAPRNNAAIETKITRTAKDIERELLKDKRGFNEDQLRKQLEQAKDDSRIVFGSDKTQEAAYDAVIVEMMRQFEKQPKHLAGIWDARKEFDKVINDKFPGLLDSPVGDNARKSAVKDVRRVLNEFIAEQAPDSGYAQGLRDMNAMFEAKDRISAIAARSVDKNIIQRAEEVIRRSPIASTLGVGGGALVIGNIVTNPAAWGALLAYGAYRVGKQVITSRAVKDALAKLLRSIEKGTGAVKVKQADAAAIRSLMDSLPDTVPKANAGAAPLKSAGLMGYIKNKIDEFFPLEKGALIDDVDKLVDLDEGVKIRHRLIKHIVEQRRLKDKMSVEEVKDLFERIPDVVRNKEFDQINPNQSSFPGSRMIGKLYPDEKRGIIVIKGADGQVLDAEKVSIGEIYDAFYRKTSKIKSMVEKKKDPLRFT